MTPVHFDEETLPLTLHAVATLVDGLELKLTQCQPGLLQKRLSTALLAARRAHESLQTAYIQMDTDQ